MPFSWIQLIMIVLEILARIFLKPQTQQVAYQASLKELRQDAIRTRDLSKLIAFRDSLK